VLQVSQHGFDLYGLQSHEVSLQQFQSYQLTSDTQAAASAVPSSATVVARSGRIVDASNSMSTVCSSEPRSWWIVTLCVHEQKRNVKQRYNEWPIWSASVTNVSILVLGGRYQQNESGSFANIVVHACQDFFSSAKTVGSAPAPDVVRVECSEPRAQQS
jgi:hypothetical protein